MTARRLDPYLGAVVGAVHVLLRRVGWNQTNLTPDDHRVLTEGVRWWQRLLDQHEPIDSPSGFVCASCRSLVFRRPARFPCPTWEASALHVSTITLALGQGEIVRPQFEPPGGPRVVVALGSYQPRHLAA